MIHRSALVLLAILALAGCTTRAQDPMFGSLEMASFDASLDHDLASGVSHVEVRGSVRAQDVHGIVVETYLVDRPCAMGPEGEPDAWIARDEARLDDPEDGRERIRPFGARFEARLMPGQEIAAISVAHAERAIGPIFGACETLRVMPAPPPPEPNANALVGPRAMMPHHQGMGALR